MGWFLGFKLHLLIHHKSRIEAMTTALQGGKYWLIRAIYLSRSLLLRLWQRGLHLVTGIRTP